MAVRAVRPWVTALRGHVQLHGAPCTGDCCHYDAYTDSLATGEDIFDPEWPDKPSRFTSSPDRDLRNPGSGTAACDAAVSGAPAPSSRTDAGASTSSDEKGARRSPRAP